MQYRISRNYLDRDSDLRWLVRQEGQPAPLAAQVRQLEAVNVRFVPSEDDGEERPLGCILVAVTDTAPAVFTQPEPVAPPADAVKLHFNGFGFTLDSERHGEYLETVKRLHLAADGSVHAVI